MRIPRRLLVALGATVLAAGAGLAVTQQAFAANLLSNPGFETGSLSPWSCTGGLGSVVSSPVHSGSKALAGAANSSDNAQCTQTVAVQPNTAYTLSAWVRGNYVYLGVTGGASTWTPSATRGRPGPYRPARDRPSVGRPAGTFAAWIVVSRPAPCRPSRCRVGVGRPAMIKLVVSLVQRPTLTGAG